MDTENSTKKKSNSALNRVIIGVIAAVVLAGLAVAIYFIVQAVTQPSVPQLGSASNPGKSCLDLLNNGTERSGYYYITTEDVLVEVYCDMETAGGGWTLVATIHQYDDVGQCTDRNLWYGNSTSIASRNWENNSTFGELSTVTFADYKNSAYFSLQASDVLIRHLPNNYSVLESGSEATVQYHTENSFLSNYGGNLYQAFSQYYPLTPTTPEEQLTDTEPSVLEQMLNVLEANGSNFLNVYVPPVYEYVYDDQNPDRLTNGGNNLFEPYGMKVSISGPNCSIEGIHYGQNYSECGNLASRRSHPFFALLQTGPRATEEYLFTIDSRRPKEENVSRGSFDFVSSLVGFNFYEMNYQTNCGFSDAIPSYCDVTFTVSTQVWNSARTDNSFRTRTSTHTNAVYGYTMLARNPGRKYLDLPAREFAGRILNVLSQFTTIDIQAMLNALVEESSKITDIVQPEPHRYQYENDNPSQDRISNDEELFLPYGMKITAYTPSGNQVLEYGKSYKISEDQTEISSRRSFPFFALMKLNNPNLHQAPAFMSTGGRAFQDGLGNDNDLIESGNFRMDYGARCLYSPTKPSICDVIFVVSNTKDWKSKYFRFFNRTTSTRSNNASEGYIFYDFLDQSLSTNAIFGYTLLSRQPGGQHLDFPLKDIMTNILSAFTNFKSIGLPCSNPDKNLVVPVKFTIGVGASFGLRIPSQFRDYTPTSFLQLRASTFNGDQYALCPGVRVETCEPQYVCVGGVKSTMDQVCNAYLDWPPNGTSYTTPGEPYEPLSGLSNIQDNIMIFYR